jgi:alkylhydroperoxidase family enzyme
MSWIETILPDDAEGYLGRQYDAALKRAGRIWKIVSAMSPNPKVLKASMDFYRALMHGDSPLSRGRRELLAVVVSVENRCLY